jgi:hypothetical protein
MPLSFWVAVGIALAALLIGLILRARLSDEDIWETFVDSAGPANAVPSEDSRDTDEHPVPEGEEMNNPTQSSGSTRETDLRRSTRLERPVPLKILGTNRRGEPFQENTSALAVNLHGCRYSSRHEYAPEGWVTLQVTGTDGANSPLVRARVRTVYSPRTPRELCQVGVELETPANVWGIPAPPEDWQRLLGAGNSATQPEIAGPPSSESPLPLSSLLGMGAAVPERRAEVTVFPGTQSAPALIPEAPPATEPAPTKAERVVITADQLLQALQGKLQLAADKAVQSSLSSQFDPALKSALAKIDDSWKANVRQTEEFSASRLAETQNLWEKELVVYRGRAEEIARRLEALAGSSQQTLMETQKFVDRVANETAPQLLARLNEAFARANGDFEARANLIGEHHLTELAERTHIAARESQTQLDAALAEARAQLSSAGGMSESRVDSLLHSSREEILTRLDVRLGELYSGFQQQHDFSRQRADEIAHQLEGVAAETRQLRSQHEQALIELRSLSSNASPAIPTELLDSLLNSSREQIFSHIEWRLGEVSAHYEQLLAQERNRSNELAQHIEALSAETRGHLAEAKALSERAAREVRPADLSAIEESVGLAAKDFETAAARASDRQLVRLMEQKQLVSQEISLELDARASEARALLQKAANSTLEDFRRRVEAQVDLILDEAKERVSSSLASLDAESRAAVETRRRSLEADVARAAEQSTQEFRSGIKAFLYSCLVAAVSAVDQHAQTTLAGLSNEPNTSSRPLDAVLGAVPGTSPTQDNPPEPPKANSASQ